MRAGARGVRIVLRRDHQAGLTRGIAAAGAIVAVALVVFLAAFAWLGLQDADATCPVTVALNGDHPARADEAAALYRELATAQIWLTSDPASSAGGQDWGTVSNIERLVAQGVPRDAIVVVEGAASSTRDELRAVRAAALQRGLPCVIVVTSPVHAARVRVWWWRLGGAPPRLVVRHARNPDYAGWRAGTKEIVLTVAALVGLTR